LRTPPTRKNERVSSARRSLARPRAGKCSGFVTEKLAFEQAVLQRGAVQIDESRARAARQPVQCLCDEFLARTRLARDENRCFRRRDALYEPQNFLHLRRLGDYFGQFRVALKLRAKTLVVDLEFLFFGSLRDERRKFRNTVRFRQIIISAELHRLDGALDRRLPREHDHFRRVLSLFAQAAQKFDAVQPRHIYVAQENVEVLSLRGFPGGFAVLSRIDLMTQTAHFLLNHQPQIVFIINYQESCHIFLSPESQESQESPESQEKIPIDSPDSPDSPDSRLSISG
jgi:hypothetical protein